MCTKACQAEYYAYVCTFCPLGSYVYVHILQMQNAACASMKKVEIMYTCMQKLCLQSMYTCMQMQNAACESLKKVDYVLAHIYAWTRRDGKDHR